MPSSEERMKILKMVEEGKISADEGAKLLSALQQAERASSADQAGRRGMPGHLLHIRVTDLASGRSKASVQVPIGLIDHGMKLGARFAPEVEGVDMGNVLDAVRAGATGKIIDVTDDEDGERVEIWVD